MKRFSKWLALVLAATICLSALWGCGQKQEDTDGGKDEDAMTHLTDHELLPNTGSATIECCNGSVTLRFTHDENDRWVWKDDTSFPLDETYMQDLLVTMQEVLALTPTALTGELSDYGLDSTTKYLKLSGKDGQSVTYYLGDLADSGCYYMRRADDAENKIYVAPAALTAQISRSIYDMAVLPQLPTILAGNVKEITISTAGEMPVSVKLQRSGEEKWVSGTADVTEKIQPLLAELETLQLLSCVDYTPSSGAAAVCGLAPAQLTMTVQYVNVVGSDSTLTLQVGTSRSTGYHALVNDDPTIYAVGGDVVLEMTHMLH